MANEPTQQFVQLKDHDRVGYKAFAAVWINNGKHTMLAAPTLDKLAEVWEQIVEQPLNRATAQEVIILKGTPYAKRP